MAKRQRTDRELQLEHTLAWLQAEKTALRAQQRRVAAARKALAELSRCDWCGDRTPATGLELQLCHRCRRNKAEQERIALLRMHGYGADGKRLPKAVA